MSRIDDFENRRMRLDGHAPTARDRWEAFYRLWRKCKPNDGRHKGLMSAFDVLAPCAWITLVQCKPEMALNQYPTFLRWNQVKLERKKNLHGKNYEWLESHKKIARIITQQTGREVTPDEVAMDRIRAFRKMREHFSSNGTPLPDNDWDLLKLIKESCQMDGDE